ncbi:MAG: phage terminase large subunit family protein, partial [Sphingomonadaceae bacterium]
MNMADDPEIREHLARLGTALFNTYDLGDVVRYLEEKTYLKGDRFSFKDHEFQGEILSDTSKTVYVQKCAQIGMSEAMARYALAVARIMPYFSVILTMPFSADASNFSKTRLTPIIDESPDLRESMDRDLDNTEIKGIGSSLIYTRGCSGLTSAISVPADMLIHDEVDRSDPDALGQYQSRIKHSSFKLTREFGTPTLEGVGIALKMKTARRMRRA